MIKFIYFLRPIGMAGPVKIGCSLRPADRLATMMSWSPFPLELVAECEGDYDLEANIHECFADLHSHGEWFKADPRITQVIDAINAGKPIEEALDLGKRLGSIRKGRGGANWSELTRQKMSVLTRVRFACRRAGIENWYLGPPEHIREIVKASGKRFLNEAELSALQVFVSSAYSQPRQAA